MTPHEKIKDIYQAIVSHDLFMYKDSNQVHICQQDNIYDTFVSIQCSSYADLTWLCDLPKHDLTITAYSCREKDALIVNIRLKKPAPIIHEYVMS